MMFARGRLNSLARRFSSEVRSRNKAALHSTSSSGGSTKYVVLAVTAGIGYCLYDINTSKDGPVSSVYWGSSFEQFISSNWDNFTSKLQNDVYMPSVDKILPDFPDAPCYGNVPPGTPAPPLLVVDLEKTLIGSVYDAQHGWRHAKRPGLDQFINQLSQYYEIAIVSENDLGAVQEVLAAIDPEGKCHKFGNNVLQMRGTQYIKRLDFMNREMRKIILVDDNPNSVDGFEANTLLVKPYTDVEDKRDRVLLDLVPLLQAMVHESGPNTDFRRVINKLGTHDAQEAAIEYQVRLRQKKEEEWNRKNVGLGRLLRGNMEHKAVDMESSSLAPSMSDLIGGDGITDAARAQAANNRVNEAGINMSLASQAMSAPTAPVTISKSGLIEKPKENATPVSKKKGALFAWAEDAAKRNEEYERVKQEKMQEIYMKRHMAMLEKQAQEKEKREQQEY